MAYKIEAEMESVVDELFYKTGDIVKAGDIVLTLNCMKMLISVQSPGDGKITYWVDQGQYISQGEVLAWIEQ